MKLHPVGHRVLVKLKRFEEKSQAGIIISAGKNVENERRAMQEAIVVEIGNTAFMAFDDGEPWCEVGDVVLIARYSGEDRKDADTDEIYRIINDEDIFATIEE